MNKSQNKFLATLVLLSATFEQVNAADVVDCTCWMRDGSNKYWFASVSDMGDNCENPPTGYIGGKVTAPSSILSVYPNDVGCTDFPHLDCHVCLDSGNVSDGDDAIVTAWASSGGCKSDRSIENDIGYYLYPAGAWCTQQCEPELPPKDAQDVCDSLDALCDKIGVEDNFLPGSSDTLTQIICEKIGGIQTEIVDVINTVCDLSDYATEVEVQALCPKFGLDGVSETTLVELICRKIGDIEVGDSVNIIQDECNFSNVENDIADLCEKLGPSGTDDLMTKVCRMEETINEWFLTNNEKVCHIEDSLGCDKRGKSVHRKLDKIKKQCGKNNKGIKRIYDRCCDSY